MLAAASASSATRSPGVVAYPELKPLLEEVKPEHFHDETHRALRAHLVDGAPLDDAGVGLLAELDARADRRGRSTPTSAPSSCSGLGERALQEDLQTADFARTRQIQEQILDIREALAAVRRRTAELPEI